MSWSEYLCYGVLDCAFGDDDVVQNRENPAKFNSNMYPNGVNADFNSSESKSAETVLTTFSEKFENPEQRDIAAHRYFSFLFLVLCLVIHNFSYFIREEVLRMLQKSGNIVPGCIVADIGCGTGLFLESLSSLVGPSGKMLANEVSDVFISRIEDRIKSSNLSNVAIVKGDVKNPNLADYNGMVDLAFICDVYHHFEYPRTVIRHLWHALKPKSGRLVVLDFVRDDDVHKTHPRGWIMQHV